MGDTTTIKIIADSLSKVINHLTETPRGLSTGAVALLASGIGATSAILAQLIIVIMNKRIEKSTTKQILIAKERSLAYLIEVLQLDYSYSFITASYWLEGVRFSDDKEDIEMFKKKSWEKDSDAREALEKLRLQKAKYYKIVTRFTTLIGEANATKIKNELLKIRSYKTNILSDFSNSENFESFSKLYTEFLDNAQKEYEMILNSYDIINVEMQKYCN